MCEVAWEELGKIPVDDDGNILERFGTWPVGTNREVIWKKFDELYPGGVIKLMFPEERICSPEKSWCDVSMSAEDLLVETHYELQKPKEGS